MSEEEIETDERVIALIDFASFGQADMPEGTITTAPYFSDVIVPVTSQAQLKDY